MAKRSDLLRGAARWIPAAAMRPFGRPVALFFHGVVERRRDPRIEINHHEIQPFRAIVKQLKSRFEVLPLTVLDDALQHPERHGRTVFLMSDDGYLNTSTVAAGVLEEFKLPWTLFVSTQHIDTGEPNPLTLARLFFGYAPDGRYNIPHLKAPVVLGDDRDAEATQVIAALRSLAAADARDAVAAMAAAFPGDDLADLLARFPSERYLNWHEVANLHSRGVEIGAHAHWHWPMNAVQSEDYLCQQACVPRDALMSRLGRCRYFAYPFGNSEDVTSGAWRAVRDAGYSHAFTTMAGSLDGGANPWLLPRYGLKLREAHLGTLLPLQRAGNGRLLRWQERLAG
jgi:peptidoglycan/xylan/chitin deacetylase (PgdA/CDA1 family)